MTTATKYALTKRIKDVLISFSEQHKIKSQDFETIKAILLTLELNDDSNLYSTLASMLSLNYCIFKVETNYASGRIFLQIQSQRRLDSLEKYNDIPLCSTNDKTLIDLELSITNMSGKTTTNANMDIRHEAPDGTWIDIAPYSINLEKINTESKIEHEEEKLVKLWTLACELYS